MSKSLIVLIAALGLTLASGQSLAHRHVCHTWFKHGVKYTNCHVKGYKDGYHHRHYGRHHGYHHGHHHGYHHSHHHHGHHR